MTNISKATKKIISSDSEVRFHDKTVADEVHDEEEGVDPLDDLNRNYFELALQKRLQKLRRKQHILMKMVEVEVDRSA